MTALVWFTAGLALVLFVRARVARRAERDALCCAR